MTVTSSENALNGEAKVPEPLGERCEFKAYREVLQPDGGSSVKVIADPFEDHTGRDDDSPYAIVVRKTIEPHRPERTKLLVNSPHILQAFRDVIGSYSMVPSDFKSPVELESPFKMLVHHWDGLDAHRRAVQDTPAGPHLNLLFDFMRHEVAPAREKAAHMIENNQISYEHAWVPFQPGDLLYTEVGGHPWILVCEKTAYEEDKEVGFYFEVQATYCDHNGTFSGESTKLFQMFQKRYFAADNPAVITDLPVYPLSFAKTREGLQEKLRERGERFLALVDRSTATYTGAADFLKEPPYSWFDPSSCKWGGVWLPYTEAGRVVLDRKTFREEQAKTQGYSLSKKCWCQFYVDSIGEVAWQPDAWDKLILGNKEKLVLRSLVTSHQYSDQARDQMLQKGKGLVMLLHGTPGSGKTLTAETAAEGTRKALIMTSVGELNKDNYTASFERELKKVLQYATTWKAIVLLDEADVFLEARENGKSSDRNSLVAVFLKELEYFSGIVFLTTNRVESFDAAMKSRIHLSLGYHPPEEEVRRRIWTLCLKGIPAEQSDITLNATKNDKDALEQLVASELNGREISNAVNTARTIARFEEKRLQWGHIRTVLEVRSAFDVKVQSEIA
ncbi:P-loop containing nucleoside triphosphate hydrolase protein [Apiospora sp. TS-2023a]